MHVATFWNSRVILLTYDNEICDAQDLAKISICHLLTVLGCDVPEER